MKIAIPIIAGKSSLNFEDFDKFIIFTAKNHRIEKEEEFNPPSRQSVKLLKWFKRLGIDLVISGKIGSYLRQLITENNIKIIAGVPPAEPQLLLNFYSSEI